MLIPVKIDQERSPCDDCGLVGRDKNKPPCATCPLPGLYAARIHVGYWRSEGITVEHLTDKRAVSAVEG